jgi:hypothetical protein
MSGQQQTDDRTGKYGGDDGAMENERAEIQPGEDAGLTDTPVGKSQAEQQQDKDLETGEEKPVLTKSDHTATQQGAPLENHLAGLLAIIFFRLSRVAPLLVPPVDFATAALVPSLPLPHLVADQDPRSRPHPPIRHPDRVVGGRLAFPWSSIPPAWQHYVALLTAVIVSSRTTPSAWVDKRALVSWH